VKIGRILTQSSDEGYFFATRVGTVCDGPDS
jgi:hypothetical protein